MKETHAEFAVEVADAYDNLYDMVALRDHRLISLVIDDGPAERAPLRLHNALLSAIEELSPAAGAPTNTLAWRRYRLLYHHYVERESAQSIADMLAISRRHFYREKERALEDLSELWWQHSAARLGLDPDEERIGSEGAIKRLDLVYREASRATSTTSGGHLATIVARAHVLSQALLEGRAAKMVIALPENIPLVQVDTQILLHILLGLIEYSVHRAISSTLLFRATTKGAIVQLTLCVKDGHKEEGENHVAQLIVLRELASTQGIALDWHWHGGIFQFKINIPATRVATILVIDDNQDIHELFSRYLSGYGYRVIGLNNTDQVCDLVASVAPNVITLDLMMPQLDGLSLLQKLRGMPATRDIPIIICSILDERQLALSLGADYVLVKPIGQQDLAVALHRVLQQES